MPSKYALSVSLTEHLCHFVEKQVASGRYRTTSEVVREALRLLETQLSNPMPFPEDAVAPSKLPPGPSVGKDDCELPVQRRGSAL